MLNRFSLEGRTALVSGPYTVIGGANIVALAEPDDIAGAAVFLASPAAAYMHGAIIPVDGGWLAR